MTVGGRALEDYARSEGQAAVIAALDVLKNGPDLIRERAEKQMAEAERKAWDSLARYKFWMFGYHAADWVKLNRLGGFNRPNPFLALVKLARERPA